MGKIMIIGAQGQLGRSIHDLTVGSDKYIFADLDTTPIGETDVIRYDITDTTDEQFRILDEYNVDTVINCAAYTNVNGCSSDYPSRLLSYKVNVTGVLRLQAACQRNDASLMHISSDYVFGGDKNTPYNEGDEKKPLNDYGLQKSMAEDLLIENDRGYGKTAIIRTSWLYSKYGKNFVKTMMEKLSGTDPINVVCDQVGTPTYAVDLASAITIIVERDGIKGGLYHYSNEGVASWYDFAQAVREFMPSRRNIFPSQTEDTVGTVKRPSYSVLSKEKIKETFNLDIPYWRESLRKCVMEIKGDAEQLKDISSDC